MTADAAPATEESMRQYYAQRAQIYERVYHKPERQRDLRAMEVGARGAVRRPARARDRLRHRLVDAARRAPGRQLAGHRPEPRDDGDRAEQGHARQRAICDRRCLHAGRPRRPALRRRLRRLLVEPRAAGAAARVACAAALAARHAARRWCCSTTASSPAAAPPISRRDAEGNTYQQRTLDDGSVHEVLKNFPDRDGAIAAAGERVRDAVWLEHTHYWVLSYTLA